LDRNKTDRDVVFEQSFLYKFGLFRTENDITLGLKIIG